MNGDIIMGNSKTREISSEIFFRITYFNRAEAKPGLNTKNIGDLNLGLESS